MYRKKTLVAAVAILFCCSACEEAEPRGRSTAVVNRCSFRVKVMSFDGPAQADVLGKVYPVDPEHPRILQFPVHILGDDVDTIVIKLKNASKEVPLVTKLRNRPAGKLGDCTEIWVDEAAERPRTDKQALVFDASWGPRLRIDPAAKSPFRIQTHPEAKVAVAGRNISLDKGRGSFGITDDDLQKHGGEVSIAITRGGAVRNETIQVRGD